MNKELYTDVVIIGGGLTGLTMAHELSKAGKSFVLVEKSDRIGGVINSIQENGFIYETGPNTGVLSHPEVTELFENLSDKTELEIANPAAKKRLIWKEGSWHPLPSGLKEAITTPLFSLKDKVRIMGEPFRKKGTNPNESVADLVRRRLGKSYLDYAVNPFIAGIYAGDPEKLLTRFALPKLYNLEQTYGSFIGGAIRKKREKKDEREKKATREVFSARGGMVWLIKALGDSIGKDKILLRAENIQVVPAGKGFQVNGNRNGEQLKIRTSKVISTAGGYSVPSIFPFLDTHEQQVFHDLPYAKVVQVALGFKRWEGISLDAFGGLVPSRENRKLLGILFPSSFLTHRAPEAGAMLSVFIGGSRNPDLFNLSDDEIMKMVENELREMLQLAHFEPDIARIFKYEYAIPQYGIESAGRLEKIHQIQQKHQGLILAGNIRDGIGMADRIKQAVDISHAIIKAD